MYQMRIGLVCPYNIYKAGGVQECVIAIQAELQKRGHDVKIITPLPRENGNSTRLDTIFIGRSADFKSPFSTTSQLSVSLDNDAIDSMISREKFDVLHFHEPWVPFASIQILTRSTCKNVATFHAKLPETLLSRTIEKAVTPYTRSLMKYIHGLTAVSDAAAEYVRTITDQPVEIIPNGINLEKYEVGSKKSGAKVHSSSKKILYIGRLERRKGVKYLLRAFANLAAHDDKVELIIAGDGVERSKLESYMTEHKISRVKFLGFVEEEQKLELLASADLFVSPALFGESFGIVLLEAMATRVPIVAGDNPGYAAVLTETGAMSLVNPKSVAEFSRRMKLFLEDEGLREHWLAWSGAHVRQFSYARIVDQYETLYKKLA